MPICPEEDVKFTAPDVVGGERIFIPTYALSPIEMFPEEFNVISPLTDCT